MLVYSLTNAVKFCWMLPKSRSNVSQQTNSNIGSFYILSQKLWRIERRETYLTARQIVPRERSGQSAYCCGNCTLRRWWNDLWPLHPARSALQPVSLSLCHLDGLPASRRAGSACSRCSRYDYLQQRRRDTTAQEPRHRQQLPRAPGIIPTRICSRAKIASNST